MNIWHVVAGLFGLHCLMLAAFVWICKRDSEEGEE